MNKILIIFYKNAIGMKQALKAFIAHQQNDVSQQIFPGVRIYNKHNINDVHIKIKIITSFDFIFLST